MVRVPSFTFRLNYPTVREPTAPTISKVAWTSDPVLLLIGEKTGNKIEVNLHSEFQIDRQTDREARAAGMAGLTLTACRF